MEPEEKERERERDRERDRERIERGSNGERKSDNSWTFSCLLLLTLTLVTPRGLKAVLGSL